MPTPQTIIGKFPQTQQFDDFLQLAERQGGAVFGGIDGNGYRYGTLGAGSFVGVTVKTGSYAVQSTDNGYLISVDDASSSTLTLPATPPASPFQIWVQNTGAGSITVDPNGNNLDGAAGSVTLTTDQGMMVVSDGLAYYTERGVGGGSSPVSPFAGVNPQTDNYAALIGDLAKLITFNKSSAVTLTMPAVSPGSDYFFYVQNRGVGVLTINRNGLTIDGAATNLTLAQYQGMILFSDGTNYFTDRGVGGGSNSVNSQVNDYTALPGDTGKLIVMNKATAVTLTLPAASPSPTWFIAVQNIGAGSLTVSRNGLTIDGAATNLTLAQNQGVYLYTDGTNYFTERGLSAGAAPTPADYLGWHNVKDYGAVGDGSTDDGPAIQAAINAAIGTGPSYTDGGGRVYFPKTSVNYRVDTTIVIDPTQVAQLYLYGDCGSRAGGIDQFGSAPRVGIQGNAQPIFRCRDLGFDIYLKFENLNITGLTGQGVWMTGPAFLRFYNCGLASTFDASLSRSAGLILDGSILWAKFVDTTFNMGDNNLGPYKPTLAVSAVKAKQTNGYTVYNGTFPKGLFYTQTFTLSHVANASGSNTVYTGEFPAGTQFGVYSVADAIAGATVYTGRYIGGGGNAYAGFEFLVQSCTNAANNGLYVCSASTATTLTLLNASGVAETSGPNAEVYFQTANAFKDCLFLIQGFANAANNGAFICTASSLGTLTLVNAGGVVETLPATAYTAGVYTGMDFTIAGFVNGANNGTFECVACSDTSLVLINAGTVVPETHAATAIGNSARGYDPSSWAPPACLICCSEQTSGSILFDFEFCTLSFGGVKFQVVAPSSSGETFGEIIMNMCVLEGQFAAPLIQFENLTAEYNAGSGHISFSRLDITQSQQADVAHPTPFVSVKGNVGRSVGFGNAVFNHCLAHSTAIVQAIGGNVSISGMRTDSPGNLQLVFDEDDTTQVGSGLVCHSNSGWDLYGPVDGPLSQANTRAEGGAIRCFQTVAGKSDYASLLVDGDGGHYFGPGSGYSDLSMLRSASGTMSWSSPVTYPSAFAAFPGAGGSLPDGDYYFRISSGDLNNPPFLVSAASPEIGPITVATGSDTGSVSFTWVSAPNNQSGQVTIYMTLADGGPGNEVRASNTADDGAAIITTYPASNQVPPSVGNLLALFWVVSPTYFRHYFATTKYMSFVGTPTDNRTVTIPDVNFTIAGQDVDNSFSAQQSFAANVKVGTNGTVLTQMRVYVAALTPAAVNANITSDQAFAVTGITTADKIFVNGPLPTAGTGIVNVIASNSDEIKITFINTTAVPATPTAGNYSVVAIRS